VDTCATCRGWFDEVLEDGAIILRVFVAVPNPPAFAFVLRFRRGVALLTVIRRIGIALGCSPLPKTKLGVLVTFKHEREWHWILKPSVASAIEQLGLAGDGLTMLPEELSPVEPLYEGAVRTISVNAYERNPVAREKCLLHYGSKCAICDVVLAKVYGEIAQGFAHVHHLKLMAEVTSQYEIDPIKDLRPVCPNCHAIIHLRKRPYSIEEVKSFLAADKSVAKLS